MLGSPQQELVLKPRGLRGALRPQLPIHAPQPVRYWNVKPRSVHMAVPTHQAWDQLPVHAPNIAVHDVELETALVGLGAAVRESRDLPTAIYRMGPIGSSI